MKPQSIDAGCIVPSSPCPDGQLYSPSLPSSPPHAHHLCTYLTLPTHKHGAIRRSPLRSLSSSWQNLNQDRVVSDPMRSVLCDLYHAWTGRQDDPTTLVRHTAPVPAGHQILPLACICDLIQTRILMTMSRVSWGALAQEDIQAGVEHHKTRFVPSCSTSPCADTGAMLSQPGPL